MQITIRVGEHGQLFLDHDSGQDATVVLINRNLQVSRTIPSGEHRPLPYRIREVELLVPDDWRLTDEAAASFDQFVSESGG